MNETTRPQRIRTTPHMNSQELLDKIKPQARPSWGPALDDYVEQATNNGWKVDTLAHELNKGITTGTNAGYVVVTLKRLAATAPRTPKTPTPNNVYTFPTKTIPMPEWFKRAQAIGTTEAFKAELTNQGIDVKHLTHLQDTPCPTCLPGTQCHHIDEYITTTINKHRTTTTPAPTTPPHAV